MSNSKRDNWKRIARTVYVLTIVAIGIWQLYLTTPSVESGTIPSAGSSPAAHILEQLDIKGRAPKTGYSRGLFSSGWGSTEGCDLRNFILARDMSNVNFVDNTCKVSSGQLDDPYTGKNIQFIRGNDTSALVQIDHVVALGDAWQKGAQHLSSAERYALANDPLNLLAVDGQANQNKGDSDAASWLPSNKDFRCPYVARQIGVKHKYNLWVTQAEARAMAHVLANCPEQTIPSSRLQALRNPEVLHVQSVYRQVLPTVSTKSPFPIWEDSVPEPNLQN